MTALGIGDAQSSGPAAEHVSSVRAPRDAPEPAGVGQEPALSRRRRRRSTVETYRERWHLKRADLVPCTRCGLRGHKAGDPDRCLQYRGSLGLGGQAWQAQRSCP
jgi:hypothetical protein